MTDSLHVRLWIDGALVVDKDVDLLTASLLGTEHAHRAVEAAHAGKPYLLEISDPDLNDEVIFRAGNDPSRMERPMAIVFPSPPSNN